MLDRFEHWQNTVPCCRRSASLGAVAGHEPTTAKFSKGFFGFCERRSLAGFARGISLTRNVLAATSRLGKTTDLAHHLARFFGGTERMRATRLERVVSRRQLRSGQKRGSQVGKTKRGKGTKWMVVVDGQGIPLGKQLYSASPHEARLAEDTLSSIHVTRRRRSGWPRQKPQLLVGDRGYDSDPLRRYRRRWIVERTFAWLGYFRRLVVRYDRSITIYEAFFHIACFMIVLRRVLK
jgi:transposase